MCDSHRRQFLGLSLIAALGAAGLAGTALAAEPQKAPNKAKIYVCPPCGCDADGKEFQAPGLCPECGMLLIQKPEAAPKA